MVANEGIGSYIPNLFLFCQYEGSPKSIAGSIDAARDSKALVPMGGGGDMTSAEEEALRKRTTFRQYLMLVKNIRDYEKENFQQFLAYATRTVNSVLRRNILKLEFCESIFGKTETEWDFGLNI